MTIQRRSPDIVRIFGIGCTTRECFLPAADRRHAWPLRTCALSRPTPAVNTCLSGNGHLCSTTMRSKKFNLSAGGLRSPAQKVYILHKKVPPRGALCAKPPLIEQLKTGGKLVLPAGLPDSQTLILVEKPRHVGITTKEILPVRFSQLDSPEAA